MPGVQNQSGVYGEKKSDLGFTARPPTRQSSATNYPLRRSSGLDDLPKSGLSGMYPSISGNECGAVGSTYRGAVRPQRPPTNIMIFFGKRPFPYTSVKSEE